ncbi:MAG: YggT family protein, partial [Gammaproteobacteria bacterium]|nr:YggT family protein [Gammaproteobacteria bacterium]
RADPHNSVSQFIIKLTTPPLRYLRRFIPSVFGQDSSAIVLCLVVTYAKFVLLRMLDIEVVHINNTIAYIGGVSYLGLLIYSIADLVSLFLSIFLIAILIQVILSWVNPGIYNPVIGLVNTLATPALRPIQKLIPPVGGIDLSPLFAMLMIMVAKMLIIAPIMNLANQ